MGPGRSTIPHPRTGVPTRAFVVAIEEIRECEKEIATLRRAMHDAAVRRSESTRAAVVEAPVAVVARELGVTPAIIYRLLNRLEP